MAAVEHLRGLVGQVRPPEPTADGLAGLYDRLSSFVRRRWSGSDADDIVQDAFLRFTIEAGRAEVRDPNAFLHSASRNLMRDRARSAAVRRAFDGPMPDADAVASDEPTSEDVVASRQQLAVLETALAELPFACRAALVMFRFDGMSQADIAERLGVSVSMVEKHVRRALAHCRHRLAEANGDA